MPENHCWDVVCVYHPFLLPIQKRLPVLRCSAISVAHIYFLSKKSCDKLNVEGMNISYIITLTLVIIVVAVQTNDVYVMHNAIKPCSYVYVYYAYICGLAVDCHHV